MVTTKLTATDVNFNTSNDDTIHGIKVRVMEIERYFRDHVPEGRRKSVALTQLETFAMWAVKAAACGDN